MPYRMFLLLACLFAASAHALTLAELSNKDASGGLARKAFGLLRCVLPASAPGRAAVFRPPLAQPQQ